MPYIIILNFYMQSERTILPPPPPITEYEKQRAVRVKMNNEVLYALRIPALSAGLTNQDQRSKGNEKSQDGSEDYDPGKDAGQDAVSDGDASVTPPKVCRSQSS